MKSRGPCYVGTEATEIVQALFRAHFVSGLRRGMRPRLRADLPDIRSLQAADHRRCCTRDVRAASRPEGVRVSP